MGYKIRKGVIASVGFVDATISLGADLDFRIETVGVPASLHITPEMIEAGVNEMWHSSLGDFDREEWKTALRAALIVMFAAAHTVLSEEIQTAPLLDEAD